jgi:small subunit ribosomal protein S17
VAEEPQADDEPAEVEEAAEEAAPEPVAKEEAPEAEVEAEAEAAEPEPEAAAEAAEPEAGAEEAAEPAPEPGTLEPVAPAAPAKRKRVARSERRQRPKPKREKAAKRKPIVRLPKPEHARGRRKERRGTVVSAAMDKTIVVRVETVKPHPVYKKIVRRSTRLHAHDEANVAKLGDVVRVIETRPLSKTKSWRLAEVLEEAK